MFRIKPHTHQRSTEGSDKCCAHWTQRPHRDWDRTVIECLLWRYRSAVDCCGGRGSGCMRPGYGISHLGGCCHWPHCRAARTYTGLGNRLLKGTNKTLCAPGSRRKEEWAHNRLTQTCLWAGVSNRGVGRGSLLRVRGTVCSSLHGTFEGGHLYLHYFHHGLASGQIIGRELSSAHQQKIGLKIYWAMPHPS